MSEAERAELEELLSAYAATVYPALKIEIQYSMSPFVEMMPGRARYSWNEHLIQFLFFSQAHLHRVSKDRLLATLAHELAHHEQSLAIARGEWAPPNEPPFFNPIYEADAWLRGAKWAQRWGVRRAYLRVLTTPRLFTITTEESRDRVEQIITQIRSLLLRR